MIKKHRILWAEALFVGVVYILHPRLFGWIDSDVLFLILAFLVLLAMHEESQAANKTVPKLAMALISLTFIMLYAIPFFPMLDNMAPRQGGGTDKRHLFPFLAIFSGTFGYLKWQEHTYGTLDDETIEK